MEAAMADWRRFLRLSQEEQAQRWLKFLTQLGRAPNTIMAYARAMEDYFRVCEQHHVTSIEATKEHIALFVQDMRSRRRTDAKQGLANATLHQRLTGVRLYYDYLVEEGVCERNPVGRGSYIPGRASTNQRGIIPRHKKLPWIPNDEQWKRFLNSARNESIRNRTMLAFAYDAALRREELCALESQDIDPSRRLLRIRAETTKNQQERIVPYSIATDQLFQAYLHHRRRLTRARGGLFLSESRRNPLQPLTIWTWSKVVHALAQRANLPEFSTHTFRHLCLTDLARAGWDIHEIARFAGHRSIQSTLTYIHLSGMELTQKLASSMSEIHTWRIAQMEEQWS